MGSATLAFAAGISLGCILGGLAGFWYSQRQYRKLGHYLSFAAHELNTPLTAVNMAVLNWLGGVFGPVDEAVKPWIEMMREQLARLAVLVGELRDFTHLELRRDFSPDMARVPLREALASALSATHYGFENSKIPLETRIPGDLPSVRADPDRLSRMISSLLFHARKFRLSGPVELIVRPAGHRVELDFRYTAEPSTQQELERALDLYYPAERVGERMAATGLGLGLIRAVAEHQGCFLTVRAGADGASSLLLSLPTAL
ncbi:MAG: HAMP domain-containing histidine kinase [Elusimicrobia bacterium]|nr:HAMP domain-containing histidine kinase [Elusimicrobiota bacterium]